MTGFEDPGLAARAQQIMAEQRVNVRADQKYVARANSAAAWRLTLLLIVLSAIVSYVLFCLALASNASLPNPNNYWVHYALLPVKAGQGGRFGFGQDASSAISSTQPGWIDGERAGRKRWKKWTAHDTLGANPLVVELRRAPLLWLPGLLSETRSEVRETASGATAVAASPSGRRTARDSRSASARAQFGCLDVVGSPRRGNDGELVAPLWVLRPRHHRNAGVTDMELRSLENLLNDARNRARSEDDGVPTASAPSAGGHSSPSPEVPSTDPPEGPPPNRPGPPPNRNLGRPG